MRFSRKLSQDDKSKNPLIDSANLAYNFSSKYTVVDGIEISNMLGKTIIVNNEVIFREADSMNTGVFVGWKEGFNGIVAVNKQNSYGCLTF